MERDRLQAMREADELFAILDDPKTIWIDSQDAFKELAADRIVAARKKAGLTQTQLAKKVINHAQRAWL
jgi:ribosome-binding protein aMBF1 (putative translation factor)